eukprot:1006626_1
MLHLPGNNDGSPKQVSYNTAPDEILQITTDRNGSYVRCVFRIDHTKIFNMMHRNLIIFLNPRQYHSIAATQGQISNFEDYAHHSGSQRMMRLNKPKQLDVPSETCCRGHIFYTVLSQTSLSSSLSAHATCVESFPMESFETIKELNLPCMAVA